MSEFDWKFRCKVAEEEKWALMAVAEKMLDALVQMIVPGEKNPCACVRCRNIYDALAAYHAWKEGQK